MPQIKNKNVNNKAIKTVVVGGGIAGWLTAGRLAGKHKAGINVIFLASPTTPAIGVAKELGPR